jgi:hypothetical protein
MLRLVRMQLAVNTCGAGQMVNSILPSPMDRPRAGVTQSPRQCRRQTSGKSGRCGDHAQSCSPRHAQLKSEVTSLPDPLNFEHFLNRAILAQNFSLLPWLMKKQRRFTQKNAVFLFHMENSTCHSGQNIRTQLISANGIQAAHAPNSPDLIPCDLWLFGSLNKSMKGS